MTVRDWYLKSDDKTHRMRLRSAWRKYCHAKGRKDGDKLPRSVVRKSNREEWAISWTPPKRRRDDIVDDVTHQFAEVMMNGTIEERLVGELRMSLAEMASGYVSEYKSLSVKIESGEIEDEDELYELEKDAYKSLSKVDYISKILRRIPPSVTYFERMNEIMT